LEKKEKQNQEVSQTDAYSLFVYAIRTQITRDYYLRRLRSFFDFIELLPNAKIELRCNHFAAIAIKDHNWTFGKIMHKKLRNFMELSSDVLTFTN
jgi:hypothetical protein